MNRRARCERPSDVFIGLSERIIVFSDGFLEQECDNGRPFGIRRLSKVVSETKDMPPDQARTYLDSVREASVSESAMLLDSADADGDGHLSVVEFESATHMYIHHAEAMERSVRATSRCASHSAPCT